MAEKVFNLDENQDAERKLLITAVDVSGGTTTPEWEILGIDIEDSSIEFNPELQTKTDIRGNTGTKLLRLEPQQSMEPYTIKGGSKLAMILREYRRNGELSKFSQFKVLLVEGYVGDSTAGYEAEVHEGCTIIANSLGGSSTVDMPIEIHFSNRKTLGTVDKLEDELTFTPTLEV